MNTEKPLKDRVALVTGASRGIGSAVACELGRLGAHVILTARTQGGLEETASKIKQAGGLAVVCPLDLTDLAAIDNFAPYIAQNFGRLDILAGCAGILGSLSPVAMSDAKMWAEVMTINTFANYHLIRIADQFLRASDAGRAVFLTGTQAHTDTPFWGAYAASKSALETMIKTYANEVAHTSLKVSVFDPGAVATALRAHAYPGEDAKKLATPESVAPKIVALCLNEPTQHAIRAA